VRRVDVYQWEGEFDERAMMMMMTFFLLSKRTTYFYTARSCPKPFFDESVMFADRTSNLGNYAQMQQRALFPLPMYGEANNSNYIIPRPKLFAHTYFKGH
jgi:hypothetical protein